MGRVGRIIWSSMALPAWITIFSIPSWPVLFGLADPFPWFFLAGCWSGALLVCGAFWRFGWRRSAARQLYLWGIGGIVGTVLLFALVIADVILIPAHPYGWLVTLWATFGLGLCAGLTAVNIANRLRKEDRRC